MLRIAIGLSGGVDSSTTALIVRYLLRRRRDVSELRRLKARTAKGANEERDAAMDGAKGGGLSSVIVQRRVQGLSLPPWSGDDLVAILKEQIEFNNSSHVVGRDHRNHDDEAHHQQQQLVGYFMRNWRPEDHNNGSRSSCSPASSSASSGLYCAPSDADLEDASFIAHHPLLTQDNGALMAFKVVDFSTDYYHRVFVPMLEAFFRGESINPDVYCNSEVKFKSLLTHARRLLPPIVGGSGEFGDDSLSLPADGRCDFIATGHYARTVELPSMMGSRAFPSSSSSSSFSSSPSSSSPTSLLCFGIATPSLSYTAKGGLNDQTHYLSRLCPQTQVPHALMPLGSLLQSKSDVRQVASHFFGDRIGKRQTSVGLCFVAEHLPKKSPSSPTIHPLPIHLKSPITTAVAGAEGQSAATEQHQTHHRSVVRQSSFRDLLAREYEASLLQSSFDSNIHDASRVQFVVLEDEESYSCDAAGRIVGGTVIPHTCVVDNDDSLTTLKPAKGDVANEGSSASDHSPIPAADHEENTAANARRKCYPFDYPTGRKVMVRGLEAALHRRRRSASGASKEGGTSSSSCDNDVDVRVKRTNRRDTGRQQQQRLTKLYVCDRIVKAVGGEQRGEATSGSVYFLSHVFLSRTPRHPFLMANSFLVGSAHNQGGGEGRDGVGVHWLVGFDSDKTPTGDAASPFNNAAVSIDGTLQCLKCLVSCRHHDPPSPCEWNYLTGCVTLLPDNKLKDCSSSASTKFNITPGQTAVFYLPLGSPLLEQQRCAHTDRCGDGEGGGQVSSEMSTAMKPTGEEEEEEGYVMIASSTIIAPLHKLQQEYKKK